jgi:hypothetical protein
LKEKEQKKSGECREQPCLIFSLFFKIVFGEISPKSEIKKLNIRKLGDFGKPRRTCEALSLSLSLIIAVHTFAWWW